MAGAFGKGLVHRYLRKVHKISDPAFLQESKNVAKQILMPSGIGNRNEVGENDEGPEGGGCSIFAICTRNIHPKIKVPQAEVVAILKCHLIGQLLRSNNISSLG